MKALRYRLEWLGAVLALGFFRLLPLDAASAVGGALGRTLGPRLKVHRVAQQNLARALPHLSATEQRDILRRMWDNLGRVAGEYPHLPGAPLSQRMELEGEQHVEEAKATGKSVMFISAHFGNWELAPKIAHDYGLPLLLIYRPANNKLVDDLIRRIRGAYYAGMFGKGKSGATQLIRAIKKNTPIGMLVDQKLNDGIAVPFFGRDAMTGPAPAQLALKYDLPVLATRITRKRGAHFRVTVFPILRFEKTGEEEADVRRATAAINRMIEDWVRDDPAQWFWVHRRWPKD